jgi:hypothetical protein
MFLCGTDDDDDDDDDDDKSAQFQLPLFQVFSSVCS